MKLILASLLVGLIFIIQYQVFKRIWSKKLDVAISFDKDILYEQEENVLREVITNGKRFPLPILQIKFSITRTFLFENEENSAVTDQYYRSEYFTVMPMQKITRSYPFRCTQRGLYRMNTMDVICTSIFLDGKLIESREHEARVCVLPLKIPHKRVPTAVTSLIGDIEKNVHINDDPFSFAGIRAYQPFDNIRSINWKVTARTGELQVNTYNTTFSKEIVLLLNMETNSMVKIHEIREWTIRIANHLGAYFIKKHIPVALYTNGVDCVDKTEIEIKAGADMSHIRTIEVALARLEAQDRPAVFSKMIKEKVKAASNNVEYIIISNNRKEDVIKAYEEAMANYNVHFVIPEFDYNKLEDEFTEPKYTKWLITNEDEKICNMR